MSNIFYRLAGIMARKDRIASSSPFERLHRIRQILIIVQKMRKQFDRHHLYNSPEEIVDVDDFFLILYQQAKEAKIIEDIKELEKERK